MMYDVVTYAFIKYIVKLENEIRIKDGKQNLIIFFSISKK